ncbi:hypothetical protein BT69DRAFT_493474 [Atractiella rhizophila]|nr:hypothetical protein BT69DRAFT_493474 [Atractiella rhizophila]
MNSSPDNLPSNWDISQLANLLGISVDQLTQQAQEASPQLQSQSDADLTHPPQAASPSIDLLLASLLDAATAAAQTQPQTQLDLSPRQTPLDATTALRPQSQPDPSPQQQTDSCNHAEIVRYKEIGFVPQDVFLQDQFGTTDQFYMPSHVFSKVYAVPGYRMPPRKTLARYIAKAYNFFCNTFPVLHTVSTRIWECNPQLSFSLCVTGAYYEDTGDETDFVDKITEKRPFILRDFDSNQTTEEGRFADLQAFLVYHLLSLALRQTSAQAAVTQSYHGCTIMMARSMKLAETVRNQKQQELNEEEVPFLRNLPPDDSQLDAMWRRWIKRETVKRVAFLVWLVDLECSGRLNYTYPLMKITEMDVDLPFPESRFLPPGCSSPP